MRQLLLLMAVPVFAQDLFTGAPVERDLAAGAAHRYNYPVGAGQYVALRVAQVSGDVSLQFRAAGSDKPVVVNLRTNPATTETLFWIVPGGGNSEIELKAMGQKPARYRLEGESRTPSADDRRRVAAYQAARIEAMELLTKRAPGTLQTAGEKFAFAAGEWRATGDAGEEAVAVNMAGLVALLRSENTKAVGLFERAIELARGPAADLEILGSALSNLGQIHINLGNLEKSLPLFEEALLVARRTGQASVEAPARNNYATALRRVGEYERALEMSLAAAAIHRQSGNALNELIAMQGVANIHLEMKNYQAAVAISAENAERAKKLNHFVATFSSERGLASAYQALGEFDLAAAHFERAVAVAGERKAFGSQASALAGLGGLKFQMKDYAAARKLSEEAVQKGRESTDVQTLTVALNTLCAVLAGTGAWERAREIVPEMLAVARKASPVAEYPKALVCAARVDREGGQHAAARAKLQEAMAKAPAAAIRLTVLDALAELEREQGNLLPSLVWTEEAVGLAEALRSQILDPALRASKASLHAVRDGRHVQLLMALEDQDREGGYRRRAFEVTERARARTLSEIIAESAEFRTPVLPKAIAAEEEKLLAGIARVQKELFREGVARTRQRELRGKLAEAEKEYALFQLRLPRAALQKLAEPLGVAEIQKTLLADGDALVEYALGEPRSYAWVVTRTGLQSVTLPGRAELENRVGAYLPLLERPASALTAAAAMKAVDAEAARVRQAVLGPVEPLLRGKRRVIVVPDGVLGYLPFETLGLVEKYVVSYAPSASALAALRKRTASRPEAKAMLLAVADPAGPGVPQAERGFAFGPLPNARAEAGALQDLFGATVSRVLAGEEAREGRVKKEDLDRYRYVHFATHGYFDEARPERSGLVLGGGAEDDGILQAREVFRLRLNADVVTLSACQTGRGRLLAGEGVMGLARAFFFAGAQSLVVSLWNVNDAATAELMRQFYGHLKAGVERDEALRRAKLALMRGPNRAWRHPYFWAPFVFAGEPNSRR